MCIRDRFGPLPVLDSLAENDVRVVVDLFGMSPGVYSIEPEVIVPDRGIEIRSVQPAAVTVTISEVASAIDETTLAAASPLAGSPTFVSTERRPARPAFCYPPAAGSFPDGVPDICRPMPEVQ